MFITCKGCRRVIERRAICCRVGRRVEGHINPFSIVMDKIPYKDVLDLALKIRYGLEIKPIKVAKLPNGQFKIKDGRHRVMAFRLLGRTSIPAKWGERP